MKNPVQQELDAACAAVIELLTTLLSAAAPRTRAWFITMARFARRSRNARQLSREFGVIDSTIVSRFYRLGLPSPKDYLDAVQFYYASRLWRIEGGISVARLALELEGSSAQAFSRWLRRVSGTSGTAALTATSPETALERIKEMLILQDPHGQLLVPQLKLDGGRPKYRVTAKRSVAAV